MNKTTKIFMGVVMVAIVVGVTYVSMNKDKSVADNNMNKSLVMEDKDLMVKDDDLIQNNDFDVIGEEGEVMKAGSYEAYAPEKIARAETGDVVLFFHASWCPSCRGLNADIEKELEAIPSGVSILKVDYDAESELRKKYGVTYQHTLVQVAADGTMIKKWSGSPTLASLMSQIN